MGATYEVKSAAFDGFLPEVLAKGLYKVTQPLVVMSTKGVECI